MAGHPGGVLALDMRGDLAATAGFGLRNGQPVLEPFVKVYDLRVMPRMLTSVPFRSGAAMLAFHPKFSGTLLVAAASGVFALADTSSQGYTPTYQVNTTTNQHGSSNAISTFAKPHSIRYCRWLPRVIRSLIALYPPAVSRLHLVAAVATCICGRHPWSQVSTCTLRYEV